MKVSDIVKFVLKNRKDKVCKDWTPYQLVYSIDAAVNNKTLSYTLDNKGNLTGIVWGTPDWIKKQLYIDCILTTTESSLKDLLKHFIMIYEGWTLTAHRGDRFVVYNTEKLRKKYGF